MSSWDRSNFAEQIELCKRLISAGRFARAERALRHLKKSQPDNRAVFALHARCAERQCDWHKALNLWEEMRHRFPGNHRAVLGRAEALSSMGRFDEAKQILTRLDAQTKDNPRPLYGLAKIATYRAEFEEQDKIWMTGIAKFPDIDRVYVKRIASLTQLRRYDEATALCDMARTIFPDDEFLLAPVSEQLDDLGLTSRLDAMIQAEDRLSLPLDQRRLLSPRLRGIHSERMARALIDKLLATEETFLLGRNFTVLLKYANDMGYSEAVAKISARGRTSDNHSRETRIDLIPIVICLAHEEWRARDCAPLTDVPTDARRLRRKLIRHIAATTKRFYPKGEPHRIARGSARGVAGYINGIGKAEARAGEAFMNTKVSRAAALAFTRCLARRIAEKKPTSMVRIGDGEAIYLFDYPSGTEAVRELDVAVGMRRNFHKPPGRERIHRMIEELRTAVYGADILGISDAHRAVYAVKREPIFSKLDFRESRGIAVTGNWIENETKKRRSVFDDKIICSSNIPLDLELWDLYGELFENVENCSVISCLPGLPDHMAQRFGVDVETFLEVPAERRNPTFSGNDQLTHWEAYDDILARIDVVRPGHVFIVAAGFLGKSYNNRIRDQGGIALDLGSIVDKWMGLVTRSRVLNSIFSRGTTGKITDKKD